MMVYSTHVEFTRKDFQNDKGETKLTERCPDVGSLETQISRQHH